MSERKMYRSVRENGLIEIVCQHGVGHPSKLLTNPKYYYGVHGCDGCCDTEEWRLAEQRAAASLPSNQDAKAEPR